MSVGVLIIGLGQIGMGYDLDHDPSQYIYTHARAFSQHPDFHLVAAVDPGPQQRQTFSQAYQCPAYEDIETALGQHQPGLVVIATPTPLHKEALQKVLNQSQPKVVLCEKPLAYNAEDGEWMVNACAEKGVELFVNYLRRADPAVVEIKRRIEAGEISSPIKGVVWYSKGFLHNGSHFLNLLEYWLGPMQDSRVINSGRLWDQIDPEPDVHVRFAKGEAVFMAAWEEAYSHYTVELLSQSGRLRYEQGGELVQWQPTMSDGLFKNYQILSRQSQIIESGMSRYQWHVVNQLARSMKEGNTELCSGREALITLNSMKDIVLMIT